MSNPLRNKGVRTRVGAWLLVVGIILAVGAVTLTATAESQLRSSAEDSLRQLVELENNRIAAELNDERTDVSLIANDQATVLIFENGTNQLTNEMLERLLDRTQLSGQNFVSLTMRDRQTNLVAHTALLPSPEIALATDAMEARSTLVGPALDSGGLILAAPIVSDLGEVLGALVVETQLTPIVFLSGSYESLGETSEAFVFQQLSDGSCQLLTGLRFERSAAFTQLGGDLGEACGDLNEDRVFTTNDYREVATLNAFTGVDGTEWGIIVKMDTDEVFDLLTRVRLTILASAVAAAAVLLVGWFALVRPIGSRLSTAAAAAEQIAAGDFKTVIDDPQQDEIGRMSGTIDRLAKDLALDIERREEAEAQLITRANTDDLTGLTNRRRMTDCLQELTEEGRDFVVVFLDLDGFKEINDTYGHSVGDDILRLVSRRIGNLIADGMEVARWGGDEFLVLVPDQQSDDIAELIETLHALFDDPFQTESGTHRVGVSIGTADTSEGDDLAEILTQADASMYLMKRRGGRRSRTSPKAIRLVEQALEQDRVEAHLQPLVRIDHENGVHIFGAEALVRIKDTDGSLISPGLFLPGLGASEQALALDHRVSELAATAVARWVRNEVLPPDFYLSLNLGEAAITDPRLVERVLSTIETTGLDHHNLVVEIPETASEVDKDQVNQLRDAGVRIAIDDVGCQYSNLERLVDIPADIAKIDRRWLPDGDPDSPNKLELFKGLVEQCKMLNLSVIAEGIETETQLELLSEIGVNRLQGFLFGRPVDTDKFERLWTRTDQGSLRSTADTQSVLSR